MGFQFWYFWVQHDDAFKCGIPSSRVLRPEPRIQAGFGSMSFPATLLSAFLLSRAQSGVAIPAWHALFHAIPRFLIRKSA